MSIKMVAIAAVSALFLSGPLGAATVVSGAVDESAGRNTPAGGADITLVDFNSNVGNPDLTVVGDTHVFGYVAHKKNSTNQWYDAWSMDLGTRTYQGVFNWERVSAVFNGTLTVSGTDYQLADISNGTLDLGGLTGKIQFNLDPVAGGFSGGEGANWDLQLSAVPVPASTLLLLSGLGSLVCLRRRKPA